MGSVRQKYMIRITHGFNEIVINWLIIREMNLETRQ